MTGQKRSVRWAGPTSILRAVHGEKALEIERKNRAELAEFEMRTMEGEAEEQSSDGTWRRQVLTGLVDRNIKLTEFADAKAGVVLVFTVALASSVARPGWDAAREVAGAVGGDPSLLAIVTTVAFGLLTAWTTWYAFRAASAAFQTLTPQLYPPGAAENLLFFGRIAANDRQDWISKFERASPARLESDLAAQAHTVAVSRTISTAGFNARPKT